MDGKSKESQLLVERYPALNLSQSVIIKIRHTWF